MTSSIQSSFMYVVIAVIICAVLGAAICEWKLYRKAKKLKAERRNENYEASIQAFLDQKIPEEIVNDVFHIVEYHWVKKIPVRPDDDLLDIWSVDEFDIEDLVEEHAKSEGVEEVDWERFGEKLSTVQDLMTIMTNIKEYRKK